MSSSLETLCEEPVFSRIFREYAQTLHHYLYYKTGNHDLAQDLTQEAFVRLWRRCEGVSLAHAKGYVFKTANNLLLNHHEHQKVVLRFEKESLPHQNPESPEYLMEESELQNQLEAAISALPEKQRVVFLLSRIDRKTYAEIAEMLGISRQAVEKRIYKALDTLRNISQKIR